MKTRLVLAVLLLVAAVHFWREPRRAATPASPREKEGPARPTATPIASGTPSAPHSRDPFRFALPRPIASARRAPSPAEIRPSPGPTPARVRLVGLVRRGGVLRAALVVDGDVVLVAAGETMSGYRVVSLDEEGGVRLRDAQGREETLALPGDP
ncbi:MAG TPA: hypothetical protein VI669_10540 [Vicinamibacteria bacterium]